MPGVGTRGFLLAFGQGPCWGSSGWRAPSLLQLLGPCALLGWGFPGAHVFDDLGASGHPTGVMTWLKEVTLHLLCPLFSVVETGWQHPGPVETQQSCRLQSGPCPPHPRLGRAPLPALEGEPRGLEAGSLGSSPMLRWSRGPWETGVPALPSSGCVAFCSLGLSVPIWN